MSDEVKLCELCRMHRKINIGPAGALWLEKDSAGDALLVVEPVIGRTLPVVVPVRFCPACGRDFRQRKEETAEGLLPVSAENMEYLKNKAKEMQGSLDEALDRVLNDCYWADKEKEQEAGTNDEAST
jgi:hypothetical protein|nr:MAG TPA: MqsA [Bacteriophage sp.]